MLISTLSELEDFSLVEQDLLTQDSTEYNNWKKKIDLIYKETVDRSKFTYRQYQVDYAALACLRRRNLFAHSQGAGKTATSGLAIAALYDDLAFSVSRVHILVPNILASSRWLEDLNYIPQLEGLSVWIDSVKDLEKALKENKPIFIYTYDFLKKTYKDKRVSKFFSKHYRPSMVVIDELHNLSNEKTGRTRNVSILCRRVKRILGLTGTLSDGRLEQISALCRLIYKSTWSFKDKQFVSTFSRKQKVDTNYLTGTGEGSRYLDHLDRVKVSDYYNLIKRFVHRVTLDDPEVKSVIKLPNQNLHIIEIELEPDLKSKYDSYINTYKNQMTLVNQSKGSNGSRFQALKLISPLVSLVNCHSPDYISGKVNELKRQAENYKKVAIFCHRIESARYLENILKDLGVVRLYSQDETKNPKVLPMSQRYDIVRKFQQDEKVKVGIFSVGLAAESIDLTAGDAVFFYCLPWQSIKVLQSISRVVRPGNINQDVDVLYFCYSEAIDKHQVSLILKKIEQTKMLLDYDGIEVSENDLSSDINPEDILSKLIENLWM